MQLSTYSACHDYAASKGIDLINLLEHLATHLMVHGPGGLVGGIIGGFVGYRLLVYTNNCIVSAVRSTCVERNFFDQVAWDPKAAVTLGIVLGALAGLGVAEFLTRRQGAT